MARKYTLKKGQTLQFVAQNHGITLSQLLSANPGLKLASAGTVINIPFVNRSPIRSSYGGLTPPAIMPKLPKLPKIQNVLGIGIADPRMFARTAGTVIPAQSNKVQQSIKPPSSPGVSRATSPSSGYVLGQNIVDDPFLVQYKTLVDQLGWTYVPGETPGQGTFVPPSSRGYENSWAMSAMEARAAAGQKWAETALSEQPWTNPIYKGNVNPNQWYKAVGSGATFGNRVRGIGISAPGMIGTQTMEMPNKIRQWGQRIRGRNQPDENPDTSGTQSIYPYGFGGLVTWRI